MKKTNAKRPNERTVLRLLSRLGHACVCDDCIRKATAALRRVAKREYKRGYETAVAYLAIQQAEIDAGEDL